MSELRAIYSLSFPPPPPSSDKHTILFFYIIINIIMNKIFSKCVMTPHRTDTNLFIKRKRFTLFDSFFKQSFIKCMNELGKFYEKIKMIQCQKGKLLNELTCFPDKFIR